MKLFILAILGTLGLFAQSNAPIIVGADGKYLGRLSANPYASDSVSNPYGKYGSPYSSDSINNPYGKYGSPYSSYSATNPYTSQAPILIAPRSTWYSAPSMPSGPSMPSFPRYPSYPRW